ncbi:MAG: hypothetical protein ABJA11_06030 [Pseudolysinimonas sp.]
MRHPAPFPAALRGRTIRTSEAPDWNVSERRIRARDVEHPFHGVVGIDLRLTTVLQLCRAYEPRLLGGQVFSHVTALALWGAPIPRGQAGLLHLAVHFPRTPPRTVGAVGHSLQRLEPTARFGLPISSASAAWCESAALLNRTELVAAGDALVTGARGPTGRGTAIATIDELRRALTARPGSPGAGRAIWALDRIRSGVDSLTETELRLLLVRHRLPEPTVDCEIPVADGLILHADLGYANTKIALEYEGDEHRTNRKRWMRDIRRRELMEDAGWRVIRVVQADLDDPAALVARIRRLLDARAS